MNTAKIRSTVLSALVSSVLAACGGDRMPAAPGPGPRATGLRVEVSTTGEQLDPDGYAITLDGQPAGTIGANGSLSFPDLAPGTVEVAIGGAEFNCRIIGEATVERLILTDALASVSFQVHCVRPMRDRLVFGRHDPLGGLDVWSASLVPDARGELSDQRRLIRSAFTPDVSPDGTLLAYTKFDATGSADLFVAGVDGSHPVRLTDGPEFEGDPRWSPDGTRILFRSVMGSDSEIVVMNADGSGAIRVAGPAGRPEGASWSPDGRTISFIAEPVDRAPGVAPPIGRSIPPEKRQPRQVFTLRLGPCFIAGGCAERLTGVEAAGRATAWDPTRPDLLTFLEWADDIRHWRTVTLGLSDGSVREIPALRGTRVELPAYGANGEFAGMTGDPAVGIVIALNPDDPNEPLLMTGGDDLRPSWAPR